MVHLFACFLAVSSSFIEFILHSKIMHLGYNKLCKYNYRINHILLRCRKLYINNAFFYSSEQNKKQPKIPNPVLVGKIYLAYCSPCSVRRVVSIMYSPVAVTRIALRVANCHFPPVAFLVNTQHKGKHIYIYILKRKRMLFLDQPNMIII
jgi:hypothetical protein